MDIEIEAPADDLEALFDVEDAIGLGDAAMRISSEDPNVC